MTKQIKKRVVKKAIKKGVYEASVKVFGKIFKATGGSCMEAIGNLKPGNCKGVAILTVTKDGFGRDRILRPLIAHRLFSSQGITREVAIKQASLLFGL